MPTQTQKKKPTVSSNQNPKIADWAATPKGRKALIAVLKRSQKMAIRLQQTMRIDPKTLDEPFAG